MSTTTSSPTQAAAAEDAAVDAVLDRGDRIEQQASHLYVTAQRAEKRKRPEDRISDKQLWRQARREATRTVRREDIKTRSKQVARNTATGAYAEADMVVYRNRKQLAPWLVTAPYAVAGETAWLLAEYGSGNPVGIGAVAAAGTAGASILAWRKKLAARVPERFRVKVQAGLGLLSGWTAAMPLVDNQAAMWLALAAGTGYMGLSWWRQNDHPIPLANDVAALNVDDNPPESAKSSDSADDAAFARQVLDDWRAFVSEMGTLPGSTLSTPKRIQYGWAFQLTLVRGSQRLAHVRAAKDAIAEALNVDVADLSIDQDTRPGAGKNMLVLSIRTDTISNAYDGPRIIREGGDVFIEVGPHEDGFSSERFHVLSGQLTDEEIAAGHRPRGSMNGGFALGTKGSGKSRLMEEVAVGLRKIGIEIWYLDPQGGKSSPALMAEADWPMAGVHAAGRAYSNVVDMWKALKALCEVREAEGGDSEQGFQHTRERPAVMAMIDECHGVFGADNPETGNSFGEDFAELDRIMRKNGGGLFGASQAITQDTFGRGNKAAVLRDGMCAVNVFLMAYGGKNLKLAPGFDDQPCGSLPGGFGLGYNSKGARPQTRFQVNYTDDFQPWLAAYSKSTLDKRVQKRIGGTYLRRFEKHAQNQEAKQEWLDELDSAEDGSTLPGFGEKTDRTATNTATTQKSNTVVALQSPQQRRMQAVMPAGEDEPTEAPSDDDGDLTDAEQRVVDALATVSHTPSTLGRELGITSQAAGRQLHKLAGKNRAVRMEDGRYMGKH